MVIEFKITKQTISRTDRNIVVALSQEYLQAHFDFDYIAEPEWDCQITALFNEYAVLLDEGGNCMVPVEVIATPGKFTVSVFGIDGDMRITTDIAEVPVKATGYKQGEIPPEPTPDIYTQLMEQVNRSIATANEVVLRADNGEFNGRTPVKGVDYFTPSDIRQITQMQNAFCRQYTGSRVDLRLGSMYYFDCAETSTIHLYSASGSKVTSLGGITCFLFLPDDETQKAKFIALTEKPSASNLSEILALIRNMNDLLGTAMIPVSSLKGGYMQVTGNDPLWCWEIGAERVELKALGSYTLKPLVAGITAELKITLQYDIDYDEYALVIDETEIVREAAGTPMRVAAAVMEASSSYISLFKGGVEIYKAKSQPTIKNCGMLFVE